eukprot:CAMPEP_0172171076 /NCGR_PEP_ID=MMETSP1050-20130122/11692_1 /TAXON_ID=233186 /ORGANISM="Cryptomonas curvata, Strain CCAP979/52" /LENGTH=104 /DNA_ID=CAMNT_0012842469 /DNA_START=226 /DNA_END=540 /DNA_ORIENTATION=+
MQGLAEIEDADGHEPRRHNLERQQHLGRRGAVPPNEEHNSLRIAKIGRNDQQQHQREERLLVPAPVHFDEGVDSVLLLAVVEAREQLRGNEHHGGKGHRDQGDQ